ncbi:MAG: DUF2076 family protein [Rhizobiales bacterium]|nr:DUF2076 family protein [Hyphomicrobiales bacterium]
MTPQEGQLVTDLFDRLAQLEDNQRDPDAEDLIVALWDKAPNAAYALVQSVLVQDEALKRASAHIQELEAELGIQPEQPAQGGSFLDGMREKMLGRSEASRGSVPSVRPADQPMGAPDLSRSGSQADPRWNTGATYQQPHQEQGSGGGSFLGTAASAAAGVVGGAMLMHGIRGLFGDSGSAHAKAFDPGLSGSGPSSPWGGGGDLAKQAGLDNIGAASAGSAGDRAGLFNSDSTDDFAGDFDDGDFDLGDLA